MNSNAAWNLVAILSILTIILLLVTQEKGKVVVRVKSMVNTDKTEVDDSPRNVGLARRLESIYLLEKRVPALKMYQRQRNSNAFMLSSPSFVSRTMVWPSLTGEVRPCVSGTSIVTCKNTIIHDQSFVMCGYNCYRQLVGWTLDHF